MIILTGVAGSGKSMQGRMLADQYGYAWISTGEILRVLVTGKRRQEMLAGKLLSDEEMIQILEKVFDLVDARQELILDGFPRTIFQADWLLSQAHKERLKITAIIHLSASEDVVRERLMSRGRLDDNPDAISRRFKEYSEVTLPILDHFKRENIPVYEINGSRSPEQVHDDIIRVIKQQEII